MKNNITGIILAGGKSSRMGFEKGLAEFNSETFVELVLNTMQPVAGKTMIISNSKAFNFLKVPVYTDIHKGYGPLGGVITGLHHSKTEKNIFVAYDMPFVSGELLEYLAGQSGNYEITVPVFKGEIEPLCGVYCKKTVSRLVQLLKDKILKMRDVVKQFDCNFVPVNETLAFFKPDLLSNINTPLDLNRIKEEHYVS